MPNRLILLNKPYQVLCKFTDDEGRPTLADYISIREVYPAGRLDFKSEGLVILTNAGYVQNLISHPRHKLAKTYWVQIEGIPQPQALQQLAAGIPLKDGLTEPAQVELIEPPPIWPRLPPIRQRQNIPTSWLSLTIHEGRNHQVRHMTAAVGHPTLRLIRQAIGPWQLESLQPGQWREIPCPQNREAFLRVLRSTSA